MTNVTFTLDAEETARDKVAVAGINFCSLWPTAKPVLQQLATIISSGIVKFAISTVITAGDAYCGPAADRLTSSGLQIPADISSETRAFIEGLSDVELTALAGIQKQQNLPVLKDFGGTVF